MLPKKRPIPPKPKKDDIEDWINKEFQNIAQKEGANVMTTLPKKKPPLSKEPQEEDSYKPDKPTPLKPNFKIKNTNITNESPEEKIGILDQNKKKFKSPMIAKDLLDDSNFDEISKKPIMKSVQEPANVSKSSNIYEKAGIKKTILKPQAENKILENSEIFAKNPKEQIIFNKPFKPKPVQKNVEHNNDSPDSNYNEAKPKLIVKKNEEEKNNMKPQKKQEDSDEDEEIQMESIKKPEKLEKNQKSEKNEKIDKSEKNDKFKQKNNEQDEYADDFEDYYEKEAFDDFDEEEDNNHKSKPEPIKPEKIVKKQEDEPKIIKPMENMKKPDFTQKKKPGNYSPSPDKEKPVETSQILANNNKALNLGKNYKKPFQKVSYNSNEKLDERKINLEKEKIENVKVKQISMNKEEAQNKRIKDFKSLIQMDAYEELLDLHPSSEYDIYMNKIMQGVLKNSYDQSNEDKPAKDVQTEDILNEDFENQCPEDFFKIFTKKTDDFEEDYLNLAHTHRFIQFVNNAAPLIEEILSKKDTGKPVKKQQKQNEFLEFVPCSVISSLKSQLIDVYLDLDENNSVFTVYWFTITNQLCSLIIEYINNVPSKFYFSDIAINTINKFDTYLLAGTKEGTILLWDLRLSESFYKVNKNINESFLNKLPDELVLRTPNFSSDQEVMLNSHSFSHKAPINKILLNPDNSLYKEIITLDTLNQLIMWKIMELNATEIERNYLNFGLRSKIKMIQTLQINLSDVFAESLIEQNRILNIHNFEIDIKENLLYFCSNSKIVKSDKYGIITVSPPNIYSMLESYQETCPISIFITNIEIFYVGYSDGGIGVFMKNYASPRILLTEFSKSSIIDIKTFFLDVKVKETKKKVKFFDNTKIMAVSRASEIFIFDLAQNFKKPIETYNLNEMIPNNEKISRIHLSEFDGLQLTRKIFILCLSEKTYTFTLNLGKFIEKDAKKVKKNNMDLIKTISNLYEI